jgi:peptide/nickel transport system substrate-binding protein
MRPLSAYSGARRSVQALLALAVMLSWAIPGGLAGEPARPAASAAGHGIAMHGAPRLPSGFPHYPHVDPAAPKGGAITLGVLGSFDSLNPFIVRGTVAEGVREYVYEPLMARAPDEPFTLYGLIAERVETPPDRSSVTFHLDRRARFADGAPVTPEDVIFSREILREKGRPNHRSYYAKVVRAEKVGERSVRFTFEAAGDREMPLIMGLMSVLPRHLIDPARFEQTSLEKPLGSGPYQVAEVKAPHSIVLRRNPDWWARDLPVARGRHNFDELRFEYFRDSNSLFEAFKTGSVHLRLEDNPARWAREYDFPALREAKVVRRDFKTGLPAGMMGFAFNTRRPLFADARVRRALVLLLDFEWVNRNLYHGLFRRTDSFFANSELAAAGHAASSLEQQLLAPFPGVVKAELLAGHAPVPAGNGQGIARDTLREAVALLERAGYVVRGERLVEAATGRPLAFELLASTRAQERLMLAYARSLKLVGIEARIRQVDSSEYENRKKSFDFDMIQNHWAASLSPGNEQAFRWSAKAADVEGSFNFPGVRSPAVDAMIEAVLKAAAREEFVAAVRALDRVLLSGDYVVPLFHLDRQWVAHWAHLKHPPSSPLFGYDLSSWWVAGPRP